MGFVLIFLFVCVVLYFYSVHYSKSFDSNSTLCPLSCDFCETSFNKCCF